MENIVEKYKIQQEKGKAEPCIEIFTRTDVGHDDYIYDHIEITYSDFKDDILFQHILSYVNENSGVDEDDTFCNPYNFRDYLSDMGLLSSDDVEYAHSVYIDGMYYYDENNKKHPMMIPSFKELNVDLDELRKMMHEWLEEEGYE